MARRFTPGAKNAARSRAASSVRVTASTSGPRGRVRAIRDCLLMEDSGGLNLALGTDRQWLAGGDPVGMERGATHFGPVNFQMRYDKANSRVSGELPVFEDRPCLGEAPHSAARKLRVEAVTESRARKSCPTAKPCNETILRQIAVPGHDSRTQMTTAPSLLPIDGHGDRGIG